MKCTEAVTLYTSQSLKARRMVPVSPEVNEISFKSTMNRMNQDHDWEWVTSAPWDSLPMFNHRSWSRITNKNQEFQIRPIVYMSKRSTNQKNYMIWENVMWPAMEVKNFWLWVSIKGCAALEIHDSPLTYPLNICNMPKSIQIYACREFAVGSFATVMPSPIPMHSNWVYMAHRKPFLDLDFQRTRFTVSRK